MVGGRQCSMLIDTGAQVSLLSREMCGGRGLVRSPYRVMGLNGAFVRTYGGTDLDFKIGERCYQVRVIVVDAVGGEDGILGLDFLQKYSCVVNVPERRIFAARDEIPLRGALERSMAKKVDVKRVVAGDASRKSIRLAERVTIPPMSERLVSVGVHECGISRGSEYITEPVMMDTPGCVVARSVCKPSSNLEVIVKIGNFGREEVNLRRGTIVATLHEVGEINEANTCGDEIRQVRMASEQLSGVDFSERLKHLGETERKVLLPILREYQELFVEKGLPPATNITSHRILTGNAPPVYRRPYRVPYHQKKLIEDFVDEQLKAGVISPSESPWASPVVVVPKKSLDGTPSFRFCVDFRAVNAITVPDVYPLPNITETLDYLGRSCYFSTLDLTSGYYQIPMHPDSREKTAFNVEGGHFEYNRMPFGLRNAPSSFQRMMDGVLRGLKPSQCLVYLDDVIIFGASIEEHAERLRNVFERLREAKLSLKFEKCHFAKERVKYLGHVIDGKGVGPDPDKIQAVRSYPVPTCVKEVQSFLGLANYYRRFVDN